MLQGPFSLFCLFLSASPPRGLHKDGKGRGERKNKGDMQSALVCEQRLIAGGSFKRAAFSNGRRKDESKREGLKGGGGGGGGGRSSSSSGL